LVGALASVSCDRLPVVLASSGVRGEDLHEVAVGVAEVGAAVAAMAVVDLPVLLAGGIGVMGDALVLDPGESGVEFPVADQERVMGQLSWPARW